MADQDKTAGSAHWLLKFGFKGVSQLEGWFVLLLLLFLFLVNLTQAWVIWEEGISTEELSLSDWPIGKSVGVCLD